MRWAALALALAACSTPDAAPSTDLRDDARRLREVFHSDVSSRALDDVERALGDRRTERAIELLGGGATAAVRQQRERIEGTEVATDRGRALRDEGVRAYEARERALGTYEDALAHHTEADLEYVDAIRAYRLAEEGVLAFGEHLDEAVGDRPHETAPTELEPGSVTPQ